MDIKNFLIAQDFNTIKKRLQNNNFINKSDDIDDDKKTSIKKNFITITKINEFNKILKEISKLGSCAIDTETDSLNIEKANLVGVSICYNKNLAYYIPLNHRDYDSKKLIDLQIPENDFFELFRKICLDESIKKIGQNIKYDIRILKKYNVNFKSIEDTMLMSYSLDNGLNRHGMDELALKHLDYKTIKFKEVVGTGKKQITFDFVNLEEATKYAAEDSLITLELYNFFLKRLYKE